MEYRFELQNGYSFDDYLLVNEVVLKCDPITRVITLVCRLILLLCGGFLIFAGSIWDFGMIITVIGILSLIFAIFYLRFRTCIAYNIRMKNVGSVSISFTESAVTLQSQKLRAQYEYTSFTELYYYKQALFMLIDKRRALMIPADKMNTVIQKEMMAFLESSCRKTILNL